MKTRRGGQDFPPFKGQFSMLPTDSGTEVDGGKPIGNENEFPWSSYWQSVKPITDEVNMLRNDVTFRAARELTRVAKELLAVGAFKRKKESPRYPGNFFGTVHLDGRDVDAFQMKDGTVVVLEQRFKVGDRIKTEKGEKVVVDVRKEQKGEGVVLWRYTFADRDWRRDLARSVDGLPTKSTTKVKPEELGEHQQKYTEKLEKHEEKLEKRREHHAGRLRDLVDSGWLKPGDKVKWRRGDMAGHGRVVDFNFDSGKVKVEVDMAWGRRQYVWVNYLWIDRDKD